ncbi:Glycoside-hydrolase family GH114 TIM-barrel domain-containing protein [Pararobbsia alpina]|uniref:endo alpha-1,4 polygalactosaminidase n=1 Tax=Pararobbsia alpina TaxID=621374 RepID=UPI0039A72F8D
MKALDQMQRTGLPWRHVKAGVSAIVLCALVACGGGGGGGDDGTSGASNSSGTPSNITTSTSPTTLNSATVVDSARAFTSAPWMSFYGDVSTIGNVSTVASTFHVMDVDLDPDAGNFSASDIATLKANGNNVVLSYLNIGSCENFRSYWNTVPAGFVSCQANTAAHAGTYSGYPDEMWMNPSNPAYQHLIVDYVAPRLVAQGADGFYLDNLEIVEHGTSTTNGPCNAACAQGGLDIVRMLRAKYPSLVIVMQNATSDVTRLGQTGGVSFASLLDGIAHEEVYSPSYDSQAEQQLLAWQAMNLTPNGHPFWIATLDYVGSCSATAAARTVYTRSRSHGFIPYASDSSSGQNVVCNWGF